MARPNGAINTLRRMEDIGDRIQRLRKAKGLSQAKLAERVGVTQPAISQAEAGDIRDPKFIIALADVLCGGDAKYLRDGTATTNDLQTINVPLISWVEAGKLADTVDPYEPGDAERLIPHAYKHGHLIALKIEGRSLDREFEPGTVIIVDLNDRTPEDGKFYIFRHLGRATAKLYRAGPPPSLEPYSTDPDYGPITPDEGTEVVGKIVAATKEYH